jgi:uncharacterized protein YktB (UPF0637 family)
MTFKSLTKEDFHIFQIQGLENRMEALINHIRPKLEQYGEVFSPALAHELQQEVYPHVAKHARRKTNPPNDTWVAFSTNKRGYKQFPHFQIGLWESHLFISFNIIYEAKNKIEFGRTFENKIRDIQSMIPADYYWSGDHMKEEAFNQLSKEELLQLFQRIQTVKKGEIVCSYRIPQENAIRLSSVELLEKINEVFSNLIPLYKLL